ncbi:MAG: cyclin-dependent kinase inhibitor 3 family protein [Acetobacteraceae bacterium]
MADERRPGGARRALIRTSLTDPLLINEIGPPIARISGTIGLSFCPGKHQDDGATGRWRRDLAADLDRIKAWGTAAVVSVIEAHELAALGVPELGPQVLARDMAWYHLPVEDGRAPAASFAKPWADARPALLRDLHEGRKIFVHCKGGLGRTGTIAARLLIECGHQPREAMAIVRRARPGAIETAEQETWLLARSPALMPPAPRPGRLSP